MATLRCRIQPVRSLTKNLAYKKPMVCSMCLSSFVSMYELSNRKLSSHCWSLPLTIIDIVTEAVSLGSTRQQITSISSQRPTSIPSRSDSKLEHCVREVPTIGCTIGSCSLDTQPWRQLKTKPARVIK